MIRVQKEANQQNYNDAAGFLNKGRQRVRFRNSVLIRKGNKAELKIQKIFEGVPLSPVPGCNPNWTCGNWSSCENKIKTRNCQDINNCNTVEEKPIEVEDCEAGFVGYLIIALILAIIIITIIIIILLINQYKKEKREKLLRQKIQ